MACSVSISCIKCSYQSCRERDIRLLKVIVGNDEIFSEATLVLIEAEQSLSSEGWHKEERQRPGRDILICKGEQRHNRGVQWDRSEDRRPNRTDHLRRCLPSKLARSQGESQIKHLCD